MGVEDAFALAEIASRLNSVNQVPRATRLFEKFRKPRVEIVVQYARRNGARMTLPDGELSPSVVRDRCCREHRLASRAPILLNARPCGHRRLLLYQPKEI